MQVACARARIYTHARCFCDILITKKLLADASISLFNHFATDSATRATRKFKDLKTFVRVTFARVTKLIIKHLEDTLKRILGRNN